MVRAILAGKKTQTRRVVKARKDPDYGCQMSPGEIAGDEHKERLCPYGKPGDRLWVRESLGYCCEYGHYYAADRTFLCSVFDDPEQQTGYSYECQMREGSVPSIHLPRRWSRVTLEVTSVRVERLQDISAADSWAEGIPGAPPPGVHIERMDEWVRWSDGVMRDDPRAAYRALWEQINGAGSWDANPWVWVVEFRRMPNPAISRPPCGSAG